MTGSASSEEQLMATQDNSFIASWRTLTIASITIAVASLSTLTIIVSTKDVDLLSTVALTLAILAFVAQLLIYIAQTTAAAQQTAQSLALNNETKNILADIRARTRGAESILRSSSTLSFSMPLAGH